MMINGKIPILHLRLTQSPFSVGGANKMIWEITKLIDKEAFVSIPCFISNTKGRERGRIDFLRKNGIEYYMLPCRRYVDLGQIFTILRIVRQRGIRIVHCHDYKSNVYGLFIKMLAPSTKLIATIHGYNAITKKGKIYCWLDRKIVRYFDRIVIVTSALRSVFPSSYRKKVCIIRNAIDTDYWQNSYEAKRMNEIRTNSFIVGFAGRISPEKGWEDFVTTAQNLLITDTRFSFRIAGDGPDLERMKRLTDESDISEYFEFLGAVDNMRQFYSELDVLLAPSWTEGLPLVQLEASAMSVPVVATDVGGVKDIVKHGYNGFLVPKRDVGKMSEYLLLLKENRNLAKRIGKNGRQIVTREFSLVKQLPRLQELYIDIIK